MKLSVKRIRLIRLKIRLKKIAWIRLKKGTAIEDSTTLQGRLETNGKKTKPKNTQHN